MFFGGEIKILYRIKNATPEAAIPKVARQIKDKGIIADTFENVKLLNIKE